MALVASSSNWQACVHAIAVGSRITCYYTRAGVDICKIAPKRLLYSFSVVVKHDINTIY